MSVFKLKIPPFPPERLAELARQMLTRIQPKMEYRLLFERRNPGGNGHSREGVWECREGDGKRGFHLQVSTDTYETLLEDGVVRSQTVQLRSYGLEDGRFFALLLDTRFDGSMEKACLWGAIHNFGEIQEESLTRLVMDYCGKTAGRKPGFLDIHSWQEFAFLYRYAKMLTKDVPGGNVPETAEEWLEMLEKIDGNGKRYYDDYHGQFVLLLRALQENRRGNSTKAREWAELAVAMPESISVPWAFSWIILALVQEQSPGVQSSIS